MTKPLFTACLLTASIYLSVTCDKVDGWVSSSRPLHQDGFLRQFATGRKRQPIVDAEFERVQLIAERADDAQAFEKTGEASQSKSLIEMSLEADSDFNNTRVPFIDVGGTSQRYIDVRLAFMVACDGVEYGIGIPFDHTAAITVESNDNGSVQYISPDDDDNEEIMQIFAAQLQTQVGEDLTLKRTPRVLTIAGPLETCTNDWMENILPKPVDIDDLMKEESDENSEFIHTFMKEELGQDLYQSVMDEEASDDLSEDIQSLFNVPGLGDQADDSEGMKELIESMREEHDVQTSKKLTEIGRDLDHDGVALKLVSYLFPGGKEYSLVYLLKPYILIARSARSDDDLQFNLLTRDEEKIVAPRIEALCKDDLDRLIAN
ncbi:hypothetical protein MPSEU_000366200 [Mayamaea pseudoterrestris]|nr:hypothetical protein MPSEU_000366200 [Mayamaea pseudoterrestris]